MKSRLVLEADAWTASERHIVHEGRVKAQRRSRDRLRPESLVSLTTGLPSGAWRYPSTHSKRTIDVVLAHDCIHLRDCGKSGVPHRLAWFDQTRVHSSFKRVSVTIVR